MTDAPEVMVTHRDIASCKFCFSGARAWCVRHNIAWQEFIAPGVSSTRLSALHDALADEAVAAARVRLAAPEVTSMSPKAAPTPPARPAHKPAVSAATASLANNPAARKYAKKTT